LGSAGVYKRKTEVLLLCSFVVEMGCFLAMRLVLTDDAGKVPKEFTCVYNESDVSNRQMILTNAVMNNIIKWNVF